MSSVGIGLKINELISSRKMEINIGKTLTRDITLKYLEQSKEEEKYLESYKWNCPNSVNNTVFEEKSENPLNIVSKSNSYNFYSESDLDTLACLAKEITVFDIPGNRKNSLHIKDKIKLIRLLGDPSVSGYAISVNVDSKFNIVIKAPREESKYLLNAINHEIIVGKFLNNLRSYIPNFVFMLGSFMCGPPIVVPPSSYKSKRNGNVLTWCRGGSSVKYIMYENIDNSISLYEYCKDCTTEQYLAVIIQIMYALNTAHREYKFTHYDLHGENILVRKVKDYNEFYLPYDGDFVFAERIATIIDFGRSYIEDPSNKNKYGMKSLYGPTENLYFTMNSSLYIDQDNPIDDCYNVLRSTIIYMRNRNDKVYNEVKDLLKYFINDDIDIEEFVIDSKDKYDHISKFGSPEYMNKINKFHYKLFIKYCREYCLEKDIPDPVISGKEYEKDMDEYVVFSGSNNTLKTRKNSNEIIKNMKTIDDYFDYLESISMYNNYVSNHNKDFGGDIKTKNHLRLNQEFYDEIKKEDLRTLFVEEKESIMDKINKLKLIDYRKLNNSDIKFLRTSENMEKYLISIENVVRYLETFDDIETRIEKLNYICSKVYDSNCIDLYAIQKEFNSKDERNIFYNFIQNDINIIDNYIDYTSNDTKYEKNLKQLSSSLSSLIPVDY